MLPLRRRLLPILGVLLGAPISAEYLQAYLSTTGDLMALVGGVVFFAPLYGGAALLIREVAVRTGRGWRCRLLLAAAFGTAMTGVIDLSLFGAERADIPYWSQLRGPTAIPALGLSVAPALTWVAGHVVMSIGAPLALLDAVAPAHRGRPLLGPVAIPVLIAGWLAVAVFVFFDGRRTYGGLPSWWQIGGVLLVVALFAVAARRFGRPLTSGDDQAGVPAPAVFAGGAAAKVALDVIPPSWLGVALDVVLLAGAALVIGWLARHRRWGVREIGLLGASVVLTGAVLGFTTPVPDGGSALGKYLQSSVLVVVCLMLTALVLRRTSRARPDDSVPAGTPTGR